MSEKSENFGGHADNFLEGLESRFSIETSLGDENLEKHDFWNKSAYPPDAPETESPPAAQTQGTVRMLSGLRS